MATVPMEVERADRAARDAIHARKGVKEAARRAVEARKRAGLCVSAYCREPAPCPAHNEDDA